MIPHHVIDAVEKRVQDIETEAYRRSNSSDAKAFMEGYNHGKELGGLREWLRQHREATDTTSIRN